MADYNSTEKISDLPEKLSAADAPPGIDPEAGDLAYYVPWGNLAIFYRDFGYSSGLVRLGKLDSGIEVLRGQGPIKARVKVLEDKLAAGISSTGTIRERQLMNTSAGGEARKERTKPRS